ncbi:MAG: 2-amino-4-hydroxy-6-hydroxymethyldihydropteridine diphosphokinase [Bacteroidales bacterium]
MESVFLSLGSNLGDRYGYLQYAHRAIEHRIGGVMAKSSVYESAPWGFASDNFFYNQVLRIQCEVEVTELLLALQQVEREAGRERLTTHYADRTLDIDILFYGDKVVTLPDLIVPHPYITERRFVLEPLCEIAPSFVHPVLQLNLQELLDQCRDTSIIRKINVAI